MADSRAGWARGHSGWITQTADTLMLALMVSVGAVTHFLYGSAEFYGENALFETGQNLFLLLASVAFLFATSRSLDKTCQSVMWALTLLCLGMFLREVDVRETALEPFLGAAFERRIPYLVLLAFGATLLLTVFMDLSGTWRTGLQWLLNLPGAWFTTGLLLYAFGDASEKNLFTYDNHLAKMTEESAELLGALFIFCAGYVTLRRQIGLTNPRRTPSPDGGQ